MFKTENIKRRLLTIAAILLSVVSCISQPACLEMKKLVYGTNSNNTEEWIFEMIDKNYVGEFDASICKTADDALKQLDMYSGYYPKQEYDKVIDYNAGRKSGLGISYSFFEGRGAFISNVLGNSPAYRAGLMAGDVLVAGILRGERTDFLKRADVATFMEKCADDELFTLVLEGGDEIEATRSEFQQSYVAMSTATTSWEFITGERGGLEITENSSRKMEFLPQGAAYVKLWQFYGGAASEFEKIVEKFNASRCTSLILDLRDNGGGYVKVMQGIAGCFEKSKGKNAMTVKYKSGATEGFDATIANNTIGGDVTVYALANGGTASASEALLGAMISYDILKYENVFLSDYSKEYIDWYSALGGEVKNGRTYGKGIMQSSFENPHAPGDYLKLTTAKLYWPNDKCIHGVGLTSEDGCTLAPAAWSATKGDTELVGVVDVIKSRIKISS